MLNPAYNTQILFDTARCLLLSGIVTVVGFAIGARLPRTLDWKRWAIILAPLCTPALLVSYTYAPLALRLTGTLWLLTTFYSFLIALKLIPIAVIARRFFPSPISAEARFCASLIPNRSLASRIAFQLHALGAVPWMTAGLIFILAFTDFELASLLSIKTWSVILFDAHVGGSNIWRSLGGVFSPLCIELAVLLTLVLLGRRAGAGSPAADTLRPGALWTWPVMGFITIITSAWPILRTVGQSISGWNIAGLRLGLLEEVMASTVFAFAATFAIWIALAFVTRRTTRMILSLPGLLGGLVLSLLLLGFLFAQPPTFLGRFGWEAEWANQMSMLANSPLPLVFAEALLLAPVAVLLKAMLSMRRSGEAVYLARMAGSRRLIWDLALQPRFAALGLLFFLSYFEFTAASILAPVGMTPSCVRLHNLAHYGQTSTLSAMMVATMLAPLVLLALTLGGARLYARQNAR